MITVVVLLVVDDNMVFDDKVEIEVEVVEVILLDGADVIVEVVVLLVVFVVVVVEVVVPIVVVNV